MSGSQVSASRKAFRASVLGIVLSGLCGCAGLAGARMDVLAVAVQRPSQVAAYVRLSGNDSPPGALTAEQFQVFEDDQPLSATETQQTLLDRTSVATHHTLLLVDVSQVSKAGVRRELAVALSTFAEAIRTVQDVSVFAFDGSPKLRLIAELTESSQSTPAALERALPAAPNDASRDLHGALVQAAEQLTRRLATKGKPLRVGTLVVFAGGPDLAGRLNENDVWTQLERSGHTTLAVGVGASSSLLQQLGEGGFIDAHSLDTLSLAFEEAAHRVRAEDAMHHLFAYCSPARAGTRRLRLEARVAAAGGTPRTASATAEFDATGFVSGCNPRAVPRFPAATARVAR